MKQHTHLLGMGHTFCALAPGAMEPLASALKYFGRDFEEHIQNRRCRYSTPEADPAPRRCASA